MHYRYFTDMVAKELIQPEKLPPSAGAADGRAYEHIYNALIGSCLPHHPWMLQNSDVNLTPMGLEPVRYPGFEQA